MKRPVRLTEREIRELVPHLEAVLKVFLDVSEVHIDIAIDVDEPDEGEAAA